MNRNLILLFCSALVFTSVAQAEIYKWRDPQGKVHFSATKPENTEIIKSIEYSPPASKPAVVPVEIYITSWCTYCKKAIALFNNQHVAFVSYDIEQDPVAAQRMAQLAPTCVGVPVSVINHANILCGFDENDYQNALNNR